MGLCRKGTYFKLNVRSGLIVLGSVVQELLTALLSFHDRDSALESGAGAARLWDDSGLY